MGLGLFKNNATCGKTSFEKTNLNNPYEDDIIYEQICLWFDLILYSLGSFEGGCGGKAVMYLVYPKVTTKLLQIINQVPQTF